MSDGYNINIGVDSRSAETGVKSFTSSLNDSLKALRQFESRATSAFKALDQFGKLNMGSLNRSVGQVTSALIQLNKLKVNTRVISNLQAMARALSGLKFTGAESLRALPNALKELDKVKINQNIVKALNDMKSALKGFANPPKDLAKWPKAISGFASVSVSPALAKNLEVLKAALKGFNGPPKSISSWPKALGGLSGITISSTLAKNLELLKIAMRGMTGPTKSALALPGFIRALNGAKISPTLANNLATLKAATSGFTGPGARAGANLTALINAMKGANPAQIAQIAAALQRLNGLSINVGRTLSNSGRGGAQSMNAFQRSIAGANNAMNQFRQHSQGMASIMNLLQGAVGGISFVGFAKSIYETGTAWQSLQRTLGAVATSSGEVTSQLQFINDLTTRMPISLEAAADSYRKFAVAARLSGLSVQETQDVFENFSTGFSAMGLSADSQKYAFIALEQILSKGQVQMEELKSQLGDHLPGAVQILAQSMNVPVAKLMKMIEAGKVGSAEIVKMGKTVKEQFGGAAEAAVNSTQGQFVSLQNSWTRFKKIIFDNNFDSALGAMANSLANILNSDAAKQFATDIGNAFNRAFKAVAVFANLLMENKDVVLAFFKGFAAYSAVVAATSVLRMFSTPLLLLVPLFALVASGSEKMNLALGAIAAGAALSGIVSISNAIGGLSSRILLLVGAAAAAAAALDILFNDGEITKKIGEGVSDIMNSVKDSFSSFNGDVGSSLGGIFDSATSAASEFERKQQEIADNNMTSSKQFEANAKREADLQKQKLFALTNEEQKLWDKINPIGEANKKYQDQVKLLDEIARKQNMTPEQKASTKRVLDAQTLDDRNPLGSQVQDMRLDLADAKARTGEQKAYNDAKRFELDMLKKGVDLNKQQLAVVEDYYKGIAKMNGEIGNGFERWTATVGDFNDNMQEAIKDGIGDLSSELANFVTGADADFSKLAQSILAKFAKIAIDGLFEDMFTSMGLNGRKNGEKQASSALDKLGNIGETISTQMTNIYTSDLAINGMKLSDLRGPLDTNATGLPTAANPLAAAGGASAKSAATPKVDLTPEGARQLAADQNRSQLSIADKVIDKRLGGALSNGATPTIQGTNTPTRLPQQPLNITDGAWDEKARQDALEAQRLGMPVPADMQKYLKPEAAAPTGIDMMKTSSLGGANRQETMGVLNDRLMKDFNLKDYQAAGITGNLAHESMGFTANNELGNGGGFGLAQWTGARRKEFEAWAKENQKNPELFGTQYDFLKKELNGSEKRSIDALRKTSNADEATSSFMNNFERPGVEHLDRRMAYTNEALTAKPGSAMDAINGNFGQGKGLGLMDLSPSFKRDALGTGVKPPEIVVPQDALNGGANIVQDFGKLNWGGKKMQDVQGITFHHTGGRGTVQSTIDTLNSRGEHGLGAQYIMDRDGKITQTVPDMAQVSHMRPAQNGSGLSNANSLGIEMIAKNNEDLTDAQKLSGLKFIEDMKMKYPKIGDNIYGHGELNNHKQETEGMGVVDLYRQQRQAGNLAKYPVDGMPTGSIPGQAPAVDPTAVNNLQQLNQTLTQTGAAAQQMQGPMQQMNTTVTQTGTQAMTAAQQTQSAAQQKQMASQQEIAGAQQAATGIQTAGMNAQMAGPQFMQAGTQMQQAGQAASQAGSSASTASSGLGSFGGGISSLLGPLASAVPGLGQFGGAIMSLLSSLGGAGGGMGGGFGSLLGGLFSEGGYAGSPVASTRLSASAWAGAPHYSEGTANTSGGMPAVLHPNEAVIPLSRGRKIPVDLGDNTSDKRSSGQDSLDSRGRPTMVFNISGVKDADSFRRSKGQVTSAMSSAARRAETRDA